MKSQKLSENLLEEYIHEIDRRGLLVPAKEESEDNLKEHKCFVSE